MQHNNDDYDDEYKQHKSMINGGFILIWMFYIPWMIAGIIIFGAPAFILIIPSFIVMGLMHWSSQRDNGYSNRR
jgi:hypothetical protein